MEFPTEQFVPNSNCRSLLGIWPVEIPWKLWYPMACRKLVASGGCYQQVWRSQDIISTTKEEQQKVAEGFRSRSACNYLNCAGAIDGMFVWITKPTLQIMEKTKIVANKFFCGCKYKIWVVASSSMRFKLQVSRHICWPPSLCLRPAGIHTMPVEEAAWEQTRWHTCKWVCHLWRCSICQQPLHGFPIPEFKKWVGGGWFQFLSISSEDQHRMRLQNVDSMMGPWNG